MDFRTSIDFTRIRDSLKKIQIIFNPQNSWTVQRRKNGHEFSGNSLISQDNLESIKENELLAPNKYSSNILEPYIASKSMKKVMIRKKCWEDPTSIVSIYLIENLPSHEFLQKGNLEI